MRITFFTKVPLASESAVTAPDIGSKFFSYLYYSLLLQNVKNNLILMLSCAV